MDWFRGGAWILVEDDEGRPSAQLLPQPEYKGNLDPFARLFGGNPERDFLSQPASWQAEIGDQYGLIRYEPVSNDATALFDRVKDLLEQAEDPNPFYEDRVEPGEVVDGLLSLLRDFGPLGDVRGILEVAQSGPPGLAVAPTMDLNSFYLEMKKLAGNFHDVRERRAMLPAFVIETLTDELRGQMSFAWGNNDDGIYLQAHPLTFRAFLWTRIFDLHATGHPSLCEFCHNPFEVPVRRGRPPMYCQLHRADKFKKMVKRGTAEKWLAQNGYRDASTGRWAQATAPHAEALKTGRTAQSNG